MPQTKTAAEATPSTTDARMKRGRTDRETCSLNGWHVGTRLVGDEGYGPTVIQITYFTKRGAMLALTESRNGEPVEEDATFWTLTCREWVEVPDRDLDSEQVHGDRHVHSDESSI